MTEWLEPADFMGWVDRAYRRRICAFVGKRFPSFSPQDVEDVWAETREDLFEHLQDYLLKGEDLGGLLRTIAFRRGCDRLRRITKQKKLTDVKAEEVQAKATAEERGGAGWWDRLDSLEKQELMDQTKEAFRLLSPDERLVLSVYCENYPTIRGPTQLLARLNEDFPGVRRRAWTPAHVKKLLDHARTIVRAHLSEKGYKLDC